jgi:endogenous inhibitor of DNA gyrase (YacG/DUF329 family)
MATPCPICGKGLKKNETAVFCSGNQRQKNERGEWFNAGDCEFRVPFENKIFGKITPEQIRDLLAGKAVKNKKGDSMVLDLENKYFTKIVFAEKKPDEDF